VARAADFAPFRAIRYGAGMNDVAASSDPILARFRAALAELYGDRIERVVLYGSRARGDALPDSDYDVAVFLRNLSNRWQEVRRITDIELAIRNDTDADIHAMPYQLTAGAIRRRR
jgi:uncharacterized protein